MSGNSKSLIPLLMSRKRTLTKKIREKFKNSRKSLLESFFKTIPTRSNMLYWHCCKGSRLELVKVFPKGIKHPIYLRKGTSDILNYRGIFEREEYKFLASKLHNVMDLGGYIGLASIYIANKFPEAEILLVEPDRDNFIMAELNCRGYKNIKCINHGVWSHDCKLHQTAQVGRLGGDFGKMFDETNHGDNAVLAKSIEGLMKVAKFKYLDFCKIDIEGSEKVLFDADNCERWVRKCKLISCEFHDRMIDGCTDSALKVLNKLKFDTYNSGEYEYFVNSKFLFDRY